MTLSTDRQERKDAPMARGLLDYFPDALADVAHVSFVGNEQHNPGQPIHWERSLSTDHADCIVRHLADRGKLDTDGCRHSAKVAWRALALLQEELEAEQKPTQALVDIMASYQRVIDMREALPTKIQCPRCETLYVPGERHACKNVIPSSRPGHEVCCATHVDHVPAPYYIPARNGRPGRREDFDVCADPPCIAFQPCDGCHSPLCEHTGSCSLDMMKRYTKA